MKSGEDMIDRQLLERPDDFQALIAKADLRSAARDDRAAVSFYKAALRTAGAMGSTLPLAWKPAIERAQSAIVTATARFEQHLERSLDEAGYRLEQRPPRFQQSIDLLTGRRHTQLHLQRPGAYYYPGLPQRRYYERNEFAWAEQIEEAAPAIRAELNAWLATGGSETFTPYLVSDPTRPRAEYHGLVDNPAWSTLYVWEKGGPVPEVAAHFPHTLAMMQRLPLPHISVRAPSVLFSRLGPGARIPPHHGMLNARLICHLPLIVPSACGFRVGGETRRWEAGKLLVFDDTVEHEAWNDSQHDRIILIFDIWRPELDAREQRAVAALFEAIDNYEK